jgi:hypothetical protein
MLAFGCAEDDATPGNIAQNKVVLLQVDYLTNAFEGGKELIFSDAEDFNITYNYNAPGDFGDITLTYDEVNQPLFAGTIIWMGSGVRSFPESIDAAAAFPALQSAVAMPDAEDFEIVNYTGYPYPENITLQPLWEAIDNLQIVKDYRTANPSAKVHVFLYTPSVGEGNPAEWDYYIVLKN